MTARHAVNRPVPPGIRSKWQQLKQWAWPRSVIFFWFSLALHAPVAYQTATAQHDFSGQLWALLSGPCFAWWGVLGVVKLRTAKAEVKPGRTVTPVRDLLTPKQEEAFLARFQEAQISRRPTVIQQSEQDTTEIPQGGNRHAR